MRINVAHLHHQGIDFAVFDADARIHTKEARSQLLAQLVVAARQNGLHVEKAALAFSPAGGLSSSARRTSSTSSAATASLSGRTP